MYRSSDLTDEPSRFRQFSWEQWEDQQFAVLFRPGTYGLDRYVVKRYAELVLAQSDRWKQLSLYFGNITPPLRTYTMTSYEAELMQKILDFHLNSKLHLRVTTTNDQLVEYEDLLDFVRRLQSYAYTSSNSSGSLRQAAAKKTSTPSIPSIHTSYVLPPSAKSLMPAAPQSMTPKTSPMKPILAKPAAPPTSAVPTQSNKVAYSSSQVNGNGAPPSIVDPSSRFASSVHVKPDLISPPATHPTSSSNQSSLFSAVELSPSSLYHAKVDGSGWVQINNVFLPFIIKSHQRLIPYQVLVSCKILETDELRAALARATLADVTLMNRMIRDCKINNEEIVENAPLINVHHVLVGTKNLVYVKILPKDNPTSKINRQYKTVLALRGGSLCITNRTLPFVCSSNHSYIPLHDVLSIYPYLHTQLKPLARVPRTHELDFLQLVQMYYDERDLPSDTLLIDMDDLNQRQIIPSKNTTLAEHHTREKNKLEQQIILWTSAVTASANKRKNPEPPENRPAPAKLKSSSAPTSSAFVRPPTGYFPAQPPPPSSSSSSSASASASSSSQYQQNQWVSSNNGQSGRTRWQ